MRLRQKCLLEACNNTTISRFRYCRKHRDSSPERRYNHVIRSAKRRQMPFKLGFKFFSSLIASNSCYYCKGHITGTGAGLDRLDSFKGYVTGNVVACCLECNVVKSNLLTAEEMVKVVKLLKRVRKTTRLWAGPNRQKRRKKNGISRRKQR